jgi:hypothetical protein
MAGVLPTLVESLLACDALGLATDDDDEVTEGDTSEVDPTSAAADGTEPL